jgi:hypothetical protein
VHRAAVALRDLTSSSSYTFDRSCAMSDFINLACGHVHAHRVVNDYRSAVGEPTPFALLVFVQ